MGDRRLFAAITSPPVLPDGTAVEMDSGVDREELELKLVVGVQDCPLLAIASIDCDLLKPCGRGRGAPGTNATGERRVDVLGLGVAAVAKFCCDDLRISGRGTPCGVPALPAAVGLLIGRGCCDWFWGWALGVTELGTCVETRRVDGLGCCGVCARGV